MAAGERFTVVDYVRGDGSQATTTVSDAQLRALKASGRLVSKGASGTTKK